MAFDIFKISERGKKWEKFKGSRCEINNLISDVQHIWNSYHAKSPKALYGESLRDQRRWITLNIQTIASHIPFVNLIKLRNLITETSNEI